MLKCFKGTNKVLWGPKKGQLVLPAEGSVLEEWVETGRVPDGRGVGVRGKSPGRQHQRNKGLEMGSSWSGMIQAQSPWTGGGMGGLTANIRLGSLASSSEAPWSLKVEWILSLHCISPRPAHIPQSTLPTQGLGPGFGHSLCLECFAPDICKCHSLPPCKSGLSHHLLCEAISGHHFKGTKPHTHDPYLTLFSL